MEINKLGGKWSFDFTLSFFLVNFFPTLLTCFSQNINKWISEALVGLKGLILQKMKMYSSSVSCRTPMSWNSLFHFFYTKDFCYNSWNVLQNMFCLLKVIQVWKTWVNWKKKMIFLVKYPFNRFIWTSVPSSGWLPVKQSLLKVWLVVLWLRSSYEVSGPLGESSSLSLCFRVTSNPWAIYHLKIMRLANEKKRERSRNENASGAYRYETNKSMYVRKVCACV